MCLNPNSADVILNVLELYQDESGFEVLLNAQKSQLSDGVAIRSLADFRMMLYHRATETSQ